MPHTPRRGLPVPGAGWLRRIVPFDDPLPPDFHVSALIDTPRHDDTQLTRDFPPMAEVSRWRRMGRGGSPGNSPDVTAFESAIPSVQG